MARVGIKKFIQGLQQSDLVSLPRLREALNECKARNDGMPLADPEFVADFLVEKGLITKWHRNKLLEGKYRGFYLAHYRLLDHIGTGGMSTVYLAEDRNTQNRMALKILPRKRVTQRSYLKRFKQEAETTARLNHPNIVRAFEFGSEDDTYYFAMEYIDGRDLSQIVKDDGPSGFEFTANCISKAALALAYAHSNNLIHRDIKPGNVLVDKSGQVKILDLGLALYTEQEDSVTVMHNERVLGTADYLSPEQAVNSHQVDTRTDIYSLGCTMYFLLTGAPPFPEGSLVERMVQHQTREPKDIFAVRPDCPPGLKAICDKMMKKSAGERFQTAQEVSDVLEHWLKTGEVSQEVLDSARSPEQPKKKKSSNKTGKKSPEFVRPPSDIEVVSLPVDSKVSPAGFRKKKPLVIPWWVYVVAAGMVLGFVVIVWLIIAIFT